jgi:NAD(P)-dependent dehydrogenase (short-subunit alcohol dehydrogenase family)
LTRNADPAFPYRQIFGPAYSVFKTALNAITLAMAIELESTGIKVKAVSPGFTKTNLKNYAGTELSRKLRTESRFSFGDLIAKTRFSSSEPSLPIGRLPITDSTLRFGYPGFRIRLTRLSSPSSSRPQASVTQMPKGHLGGPLQFRLRRSIRCLDG